MPSPGNSAQFQCDCYCSLFLFLFFFWVVVRNLLKILCPFPSLVARDALLIGGGCIIMSFPCCCSSASNEGGLLKTVFPKQRSIESSPKSHPPRQRPPRGERQHLGSCPEMDELHLDVVEAFSVCLRHYGRRRKRLKYRTAFAILLMANAGVWMCAARDVARSIRPP